MVMMGGGKASNPNKYRAGPNANMGSRGQQIISNSAQYGSGGPQSYDNHQVMSTGNDTNTSGKGRKTQDGGKNFYQN
jgi:hypothetical protein